MPKCFKCSAVFGELPYFRSHLRRHNITKDDPVFCVEATCGHKRFQNLSSLTRHYKLTHKIFPGVNVGPQNSFNNPEVEHMDDEVVELGITDHESSFTMNEEKSDPVNAENLSSQLQEEIDIFLCKLYENPRITRKQIQNIVSYSQNLLQSVASSLKSSVLVTLKSLNASPDVEFQWEDIFEVLENPFENLRSDYIRTKVFAKEGSRTNSNFTRF